MGLKMYPKDIHWWFWLITLVFIVAALTGWSQGYYFVIGISAFQVLYFLIEQKSLTTLPSQIRLVYFLYTLLGLWNEGRFIAYLILLFGTLMVVFWDRCSIALFLKHMPWNKKREIKSNWIDLLISVCSFY